MVEQKASRLYYGYVIVFISFCLGALAWGSLRTFGVFLEPLIEQFHWLRATISLAFTFCMIMTGVLAIITGRLSDRFGPRIVLTVCGFLVGVSYFLLSQSGSLWQFYAIYALPMAAGMGGVTVPLTSAVTRWFHFRNNLMNGIVHAGPAFGITVIPLLAGWLLSIADWRRSYLVIGAFLLVLMVAGAQLLRRNAALTGLEPSGHQPSQTGGAEPAPRNFTLMEALKSRRFWTLSALFFGDFFCVNVVMVHIVIHATDIQVPQEVAVTVLSVTAAVSIGGRIVAGAVADRIGRVPTIAIGLTATLLSFIWLIFARELWGLYLFAVIFGIGGWAVGAVMSPMVAEYFGMRSHGVILGAITFVSTLGGAVGPLIAGWTFDSLKSYRVTFIICAVLAAVCLALMPLLKREKMAGRILFK